MSKNHLTRLVASKTWPIKRKGIQFITKQNPGPHSLMLSMPLNIILKEMLGSASNTREAKKILVMNDVMVDCIRRRDLRFPVGLFDTLSFSNINGHFRAVINKKGKIVMVNIKKEEAALKPAKIIGKTMVGGRPQINLYDGKNIAASSNSYKVGDTLLISLPKQEIAKHLKLEKKSTIFLTGGKHVGEIGTVEDMDKNKIIYKDSSGNIVETSKKYAFVIGDTKPLITIG
ncbi:30S ribosomal protein S4e [Candidatus Woesearchaeota archaeon]|nr:30S ribosomal protein S4e [Candidatus Woesearchaeota archaeon]